MERKSLVLGTLIGSAGIGILLFVLFVFAFGPSNPDFNAIDGNDGITLKPVYHVTLERDGRVIYNEDVGNLITNDGLNWARDKLGQGFSPGGITHMALTADSADPVATDTNLSEEYTTGGLARAAGTYSQGITNGNWSISYKWTATAENTVWKFGVFNGSTLWNGTEEVNVMFSEGNFTANVSMQANDELTVNVTYVIS